MFEHSNKVPQTSVHPNYPELQLSKIIYGTWRLLDDREHECTPQRLLDRIKHCLAHGITTFDLADIYGGGQHQCEQMFGRALTLAPEIRSQMQLITKCGIVCPDDSGNSLKYYDTSRQYILRRVQESLQNVGCSYFDVLLIHRPDPFMDPRDTALAMHELREAGTVRYFGVSNFSCRQVEMLQSYLDEFDIKLVTNQIEMSPLHLEPLYNDVLEQCLQLRMKPMIWSPLAGGRIFRQQQLESSNVVDTERIERLRKCLKEMAAEVNCTADQLCYSWLMTHPSQPMPIVGSNKIERIDSAISAAKLHLSRKQWFRILEAANGQCVP